MTPRRQTKAKQDEGAVKEAPRKASAKKQPGAELSNERKRRRELERLLRSEEQARAEAEQRVSEAREEVVETRRQAEEWVADVREFTSTRVAELEQALTKARDGPEREKARAEPHVVKGQEAALEVGRGAEQEGHAWKRWWTSRPTRRELEAELRAVVSGPRGADSPPHPADEVSASRPPEHRQLEPPAHSGENVRDEGDDDGDSLASLGAEPKRLSKGALAAVEAVQDGGERSRPGLGSRLKRHLWRRGARPGQPTCAVCQRHGPTLLPEELAAGGWIVQGEVSVCPSCRDRGWQVPNDMSLPVRPFSERRA